MIIGSWKEDLKMPDFFWLLLLLHGKVLPRILRDLKLWSSGMPLSQGYGRNYRAVEERPREECQSVRYCSQFRNCSGRMCFTFKREFIAAKTQTWLQHWVGGYLIWCHTCHFNLPGYPFKTASSWQINSLRKKKSARSPETCLNFSNREKTFKSVWNLTLSWFWRIVPTSYHHTSDFLHRHIEITKEGMFLN